MAVVIHAMPLLQRNQHSEAASFHVHYPVAAPAFFCKHHLLADAIHIRLDIGTLLLVADQYPLRGGGHNHIFQPHGQHRHIQGIDDMHIFAGIIGYNLANRIFIHRFR